MRKQYCFVCDSTEEKHLFFSLLSVMLAVANCNFVIPVCDFCVYMCVYEYVCMCVCGMCVCLCVCMLLKACGVEKKSESSQFFFS